MRRQHANHQMKALIGSYRMKLLPSSVPKKVKIHHYQRRTIRLKTPIILAIVAVVVGTSLGLVVIRTITSEQAVPAVIEPPKQNIPAVAPVTEPSTTREI